VKPIPPCAWIDRSHAATAASAHWDFAAAAAIGAWSSPIAMHQAAQSASERPSSSSR
jgi:hypothetical protein